MLATLADASVQCCVTSPPYFGLRDYGTAEWDGGDPGCDHLMPASGTRNVGRDRAASGGMFHDSRTPNQIRQQYTRTCGKCGATRIDAQIGAEATPDAYVAALVEVFREVKRVLHPTGTCWINLGDSYAGGKTGRGDAVRPNGQGVVYGGKWETEQRQQRPVPDGCKPKDLLMIPARVALALQADGWWLRSAIVWAKPNPMPESVTDRCTSSYEMVYMLAKSARYFFDADAVKEPNSPTGEPWGVNRNIDAKTDESRRDAKSLNGAGLDPGRYFGNGRNCRNVWTIATTPSSIGHFALMPPPLAERCIKAGSRPGDTVLDPFGGAGTTGLVADRLGRDAVLIELSAGYTEAGHERIRADCPLFAEVATV